MRAHSLFVLVAAAAAISLYPASALAQHAGGGGAMPASQPGANNPNSSPDLNRQSQVQRVDDRKFLQNATMGGLTEIALGKLAVEKGSSDDVKQFGQKMIDDHTKADADLKQIATGGSMNVPDSLDSKHQSQVDKLAKLSGEQFDKAYIKEQVKFHEQNVKEFQDEAQYGSVAEVKNVASKGLPAIQEHLELAKELNKNKK